MPVALKAVKLLGTDYPVGATVPSAVWANVPERNRRVLTRGNHIGPDVTPARLSGGRPQPRSLAKKGA